MIESEVRMVKILSQDVNDKVYPYTIVEVVIERSRRGDLSLDILSELKLPKVNKDRGVVLSGAGPLWLFLAISGRYAVKWLAVYDPIEGGAIVTQRHHPDAPAFGSVLPVNL